MAAYRFNLLVAAVVVMACSFGIAQEISATNLSPGAAEVARLYGISPLLDRLGQARTTEAEGPPTLETLAVRQEILESVVTAGLEVDGVLAEIDDESSQCSEVRAYLEARRDRSIGINTIVSMVTGGGVGVAGQLLQIHHGTAGGIVGAVAGGASTVLSAFALHQQQGGKHVLGVAPNMLAMLFDRKGEFHSSYPEPIWKYLNSVRPGTEGQTRRQELISHWTQLRRIDPQGSAKAPQKIELLTSSISLQQPLTISLLQDREAMLADVRSQVSLIKRDLSKLMLALKTR